MYIGNIDLPILYAEVESERLQSMIESDPFVDTPTSILNELRWMSKRMRAMRLTIDPELPMTTKEIVELLIEAEFAMMSSQHQEVSETLSSLLSRRKVTSNSAYPQLLKTIGTALINRGIPRLGA